MRNYFNYFTEVEEHFARQRGRQLFVSPLDWCLIELWKDSGIPLHVVLRGIDRSFESAAARAGKPPRTLYYCHPAVTEAFEQHQAAHVGGHDEENTEEASAFSRSEVRSHLQGLADQVGKSGGEVFERAGRRLQALVRELDAQPHPDYRVLDQSLGQVGGLVAEALQDAMDRTAVEEIKKSVRRELKVYRKYLSSEAYRELFDSYLNRQVLEEGGFAGFSLFDLNCD